jgi:hypothetical protein
MESLGRLSRRALRLAVPALAFGAAFLCPAVSAAPLDKNACAKVSQVLQNLKALDVDKLMQKGPSWAAANLSPADLWLVRQYIDLDEQIKFRCLPPGSLVRLKNLEDEDEDGAAKPAAGVDKAQGASSEHDDKAARGAKPAKKKPSAQAKQGAPG